MRLLEIKIDGKVVLSKKVSSDNKPLSGAQTSGSYELECTPLSKREQAFIKFHDNCVELKNEVITIIEPKLKPMLDLLASKLKNKDKTGAN